MAIALLSLTEVQDPRRRVGCQASQALTSTLHHMRDTFAGNYRTAVAHIITAVIGSGVLALGYSVGTIGWVRLQEY